jgi:hypothetical protein
MNNNTKNNVIYGGKGKDDRPSTTILAELLKERTLLEMHLDAMESGRTMNHKKLREKSKYVHGRKEEYELHAPDSAGVYYDKKIDEYEAQIKVIEESIRKEKAHWKEHYGNKHTEKEIIRLRKEIKTVNGRIKKIQHKAHKGKMYKLVR